MLDSGCAIKRFASFDNLCRAFDAPSRERCTGERFPATTPLQALALLNGPAFVESARVLAQRLITEGEDDASRLDLLYRKTLNRSPRAEEKARLNDLLASQREHFTANPEDAAKLAAACPDTTFILQHAGMLTETTKAAWTEWREAMATLAAQPNVVTKLSAFGTFIRATD